MPQHKSILMGEHYEPVTISLPRGLRDELVARAKREDRSVSAEARRALREYLGRYEEADDNAA